MKKFFIILTALLLCVVLAACGGDSSGNGESTESGNASDESSDVTSESNGENSENNSENDDDESASQPVHSHEFSVKSDENSHWQECDCGENTDAEAHSYGEWEVITASTCKESGSQSRSCTVCEYSQTEELPLSEAHAYSSAWTVTKEPTCIEAGEESRICTVCEIAETRAVSATGKHKYGDWKEISSATCVSYGEEKRTCSMCGNAETNSISPTGVHTYGEWKITTPVSCASDGVRTQSCTGCDKTITEKIPSTGHSYTSYGECANCSIGKTISFGSYEQDNNTSNGKEDIEWIVLEDEGDRLLVVSRYVLNCKQYNTEKTAMTWAKSSLRTWLNNSFLQSAFSGSEQNRILTTEVENDSYYVSVNGGKDTQDKIYLLSYDEVEKYFPSNSERICEATSYAQTTRDFYGDTVGVWWLRTTGFFGYTAVNVSEKGDINTTGSNVTSVWGIRPVMWITVS